MLFQISGTIKAFQPDIVHSNSSTIDFGYLISQLFQLPHIWHIREFLDLDYGLENDFGKHQLIQKLERSDGVIYVSNVLSDHFNNAGDHSIVIYNGVMPTSKAGSLRPGSSRNFHFGIIGLIDEFKGQFEVVKAISSIKEMLKEHNIVINIFGQGNELSLLNLAKHLEVIDYVTLKGYYDNLKDMYGECNAVIVASKNEAMGRVTAEAMLFKIPVIGYKNAGTNELIEHGETGLLYRNAEELCYNIVKIATDSELRESIVRKAYNFGINNFADEVYGNKVIKFYDTIINNT